jgi:predicted DNA-binding transcriptional regulator AlpA
VIPSELLRFKDLKRVGINNWPTLKRRIEQDNFPPGRYLGPNTRAWSLEEVQAWWEARPKADPPNVKPAAPVISKGDRPELKKSLHTPSNSRSDESAQPLTNRRGSQ